MRAPLGQRPAEDAEPAVTEHLVDGVGNMGATAATAELDMAIGGGGTGTFQQQSVRTSATIPARFHLFLFRLFIVGESELTCHN